MEQSHYELYKQLFNDEELDREEITNEDRIAFRWLRKTVMAIVQ